MEFKHKGNLFGKDFMETATGMFFDEYKQLLF